MRKKLSGREEGEQTRESTWEKSDEEEILGFRDPKPQPIWVAPACIFKLEHSWLAYEHFRSVEHRDQTLDLKEGSVTYVTFFHLRDMMNNWTTL